MKTKTIFKSLFLLVVFLSISFSSFAYSASLRDKLDNLDGNNTHLQTIATNGGMATNKNLPKLLSSGIKLVLGLFGTVALIFVIRAGILWMGSKGDASKIKEARKIIAAGVIGLAIISTSYASTDFILDQVIISTNKGYENSSDYTNPDGTTTSCDPTCNNSVTYANVYNGNSCLNGSTTSGVLSAILDPDCGVSTPLGDKESKRWDCLCNNGVSVSCFSCKVAK